MSPSRKKNIFLLFLTLIGIFLYVRTACYMSKKRLSPYVRSLNLHDDELEQVLVSALPNDGFNSHLILEGLTGVNDEAQRIPTKFNFTHLNDQLNLTELSNRDTSFDNLFDSLEVS